MFERECERAMFAQDPGEYDMEELGFTREFEKREQIIKIEKQRPTEYVIYHDLKEMWKRRQGMDLPFVNVGSFVEVKLRSKWGLSRPVTYGGVVIEKEHKDLSAHFILRKNLSSYGKPLNPKKYDYNLCNLTALLSQVTGLRTLSRSTHPTWSR